jgi:hypothetical protein
VPLARLNVGVAAAAAVWIVKVALATALGNSVPLDAIALIVWLVETLKGTE